MIKNLQVKIKNIHVRYEDKYTDAKRPFAAGATLESLDFEVFFLISFFLLSPLILDHRLRLESYNSQGDAEHLLQACSLE